MTIRRLAILALCALLTAVPASAGESRIEACLRELDGLLMQKESFDDRKESVLESMRAALRRATSDDEAYSRIRDLWREYSYYQYDSAYTYVQKMMQLAERSGSAPRKAEAAFASIECMLSAGLYKEAFDVAASVDVPSLGPEALKEFYRSLLRLNYSAANYNQTEPWFTRYRSEGARYSSLLMSLLPEDSAGWKECKANLLMENGDYPRSVLAFKELLGSPDLDLHQRAIYTSSIGWMQSCLGEEEEAILYTAEAAMCDLRSSTKETTALRMLAQLLSARGEIERPVRYVRHSFDDANSYGTRLRKLETGSVLPLVERNYNESLGHERNLLALVLLLTGLLFVAAFVGLWAFRRQNKRLDEAGAMIAERNSELESINARLAEVNNIKDEYIGNSFYITSEYIDRLSEFQKTVDRMLVTGQYDLLRRSLKESTISKERDRMYEAFDATFLKIFPTFINDYNALFPEDARQYPEDGLTSEMRIFALIRLGISESERIARFLDYSVHTINTYKTRVKNRSLLDNEQFESEIMRIGLR